MHLNEAWTIADGGMVSLAKGSGSSCTLTALANVKGAGFHLRLPKALGAGNKKFGWLKVPDDSKVVHWLPFSMATAEAVSHADTDKRFKNLLIKKPDWNDLAKVKGYTSTFSSFCCLSPDPTYVHASPL